MKIDLYERIWMALGVVLIVAFLGIMIVMNAAHAVQPPSHIETVDPKGVWDDPRFADLGVTLTPEGATVELVAQMYAFLPAELEVPVGKPVTFRMSSADVVHGFEIVGTNANATLIPGYITEFTVTFPRTGEYLIVCNEFCGIGHHGMFGKVIAGGEPHEASE